MDEITTLELGEEEVSTTLATGEEEPVTGYTTWNLGEEDPLNRPSTKMYGEEGEFLPDTSAGSSAFGGF